MNLTVTIDTGDNERNDVEGYWRCCPAVYTEGVIDEILGPNPVKAKKVELPDMCCYRHYIGPTDQLILPAGAELPEYHRQKNILNYYGEKK